MRDLEIEKKKTDTLLYQMLPVEVANELREGRTVEAGRWLRNCHWVIDGKLYYR